MHNLSTVIIVSVAIWFIVQGTVLQLNSIHHTWCILRTQCTEHAVITIHKWCEAYFVLCKANNVELLNITQNITIFSIMTWMPLNGLPVWCEEMLFGWWVIIWMLLVLIFGSLHLLCQPVWSATCVRKFQEFNVSGRL